MSYREYKDKSCIICGKTFQGRLRASYCCVECKKEGARRNERKRRAEKQLIVVEKKQKGQTLADIAKKAREAGMQYGDYVAKFGL